MFCCIIKEIKDKKEEARDLKKGEVVSIYKNDSKEPTSDFLVLSHKMKEVLGLVKKFSLSDLPVLVYGETGTGKEQICRELHNHSNRRGEFVVVDCTAIPEALFESELFGSEKGSYTGSIEKKEGLVKQAHQGTIFFDEISELPLILQAKLLRFIQEKEFKPIGGKKNEKVEIKIVAATNKNLEEMVSGGKFRQDLYYRLNVLLLNIPSLFERGKEEIIGLANYFAGSKILHKSAIELLLRYDWPGNVRELENVICATLVYVEEREIIYADDIVPMLGKNKKTKNISSLANLIDCFKITYEELKEIHEEEVRDLFLKALEENEYVIQKAADQLKMNRSTLVEAMKRLEIKNKKSEIIK